MSGSLHSEIIADSENVFTGKPTDFKLNNFDQQILMYSACSELFQNAHMVEDFSG